MQVYPFHIPALPPSVNKLYGQSRHGGRFKNQAVTDFIQEAGWHLKRPKNPIAEPVRLTVSFTIKDTKGKLGQRCRRRDLDNMLKVLCDLLMEMLVIEDDGLIYKISATKKPGAADGVYGLIEPYRSLAQEGLAGVPLVAEVEGKRRARKDHKVVL